MATGGYDGFAAGAGALPAGAGQNTNSDYAWQISRNLSRGEDDTFNSWAEGQTKQYGSSADMLSAYKNNQQASLQQDASIGAAKAAIGSTAPGQDVFSQKLAGMATGQFSPDDPSYQWRLGQGEQALERSQAARGNLGSGNILTAITDYAQGAASQEYSAQFDRMLKGSANVTSQYSAAYNTLAQMMGQQTSQTNANTGAFSANTKASGQRFDEDVQTNKSAGAGDMLSSLYQQPTGAAYWAQQDAQAQQQQQQQRQNYTAPMNGYTPATGGNQGSEQGSGWFAGSSGGSGTFGDSSSASGFGGEA